MKKENVLGDGIGFIELVDLMGSDLTIVNSARVSFGSRSDWKYEDFKEVDVESRTIYEGKRPVGLKKKDRVLIDYLAENKHWSPFRHVQFQFHIKMPECIARQMYKHVIGCNYVFNDHAWNEISGRYKVLDDEFYVPVQFRKQSKDNKQASEGEFDEANDEKMREIYHHSLDVAYKSYKELIEYGVAKEQARGVLPVSFYTEFFWSASLQAVANFITLRESSHAQQEIQFYALAMKELAMSVCPEGLSALLESMK